MGRLVFIWSSIILGIALLLWLPIIFTNSLYFDINQKKVGFSLRLYGIFQLLGGYLAAYPGGIAVHRSEKNATILPYKDMEKERKRVSFMRLFRIINVDLTTETGAEYLLWVGSIQAVLRVAFFLYGGKKEQIENNLWLTDGDRLKISIRIAAYFNVFMLLCTFVKVIKEKIKLWRMKNVKSTA